MAAGMEMMLKAMGFNPAALQQQAQQMAAQLQATMRSIDTRLERIEAKQVAIEAKLAVLMADEFVPAPIPAPTRRA